MHGLLLIYLAILSYSDRFVPHSIVWSWAPKRNQAVAIAIGVQQRTRAALVTSALGPSRPNWAVRAMSGFPPIATGLRTSRIGSFVPIAAVSAPSACVGK
jgi:hypothetical protein